MIIYLPLINSPNNKSKLADKTYCKVVNDWKYSLFNFIYHIGISWGLCLGGSSGCLKYCLLKLKVKAINLGFGLFQRWPLHALLLHLHPKVKKIQSHLYVHTMAPLMIFMLHMEGNNLLLLFFSIITIMRLSFISRLWRWSWTLLDFLLWFNTPGVDFHFILESLFHLKVYRVKS